MNKTADELTAVHFRRMFDLVLVDPFIVKKTSRESDLKYEDLVVAARKKIDMNISRINAELVDESGEEDEEKEVVAKVDEEEGGDDIPEETVAMNDD